MAVTMIKQIQEPSEDPMRQNGKTFFDDEADMTFSFLISIAILPHAWMSGRNS
jgi:hypothetical protein